MKKIFAILAFLVSVCSADIISNGIAVNEHTIITTSHSVFGTDSGTAVVNGVDVRLRLLVQSKQEDNMVDFAIVTVPDSVHLNACQIAPIFAEDGETVEMYGNIYENQKLSKYSISGKVYDDDPRMPFEYIYSIKAKGRYGLSGGPLFYKGHIIGMTVSLRTDEDISYAYTYDVLAQYLEEAKVKAEPNTRDVKKCVYTIVGYTHKKK